MMSKYKKYKHIFAGILMFLSAAIPFTLATPAHAACAKTVAISHGKLCQSTGEVTCDTGFTAQYSGSALTCAKKNSTAATGGSNDSGTGNTSGGSSGQCVVGNEASCAVNPGKCSSAKDTVANCTDPAASGDNVTCTSKNCDLINKYIDPLIALLSAAVGIAVTISIIIGGIQYSSSGGDPSKVSAAKNRIRNSIVALVAYLFLFALLQFLIPGGLFKS